MGRATQGVRLINLKGNDSIAAVAKVMREDEEELEANNDQSDDGSTSEINSDQTDGTTFDKKEEEQ